MFLLLPLNLYAGTTTTSQGRAENDFTNTWFRDPSQWIESYGLNFTVESNTLVELMITENVGIYGNNWCSLGLFLNDATEPFAVGSWSGTSGTTTFNNVNLFGVVYILPAGQNTIFLKHMSQYCHYGNAPFAFPVGKYYLKINTLEGAI